MFMIFAWDGVEAWRLLRLAMDGGKASNANIRDK
jgi:hypothetical protein